jgi:hypothetical protein
MIKRRGTAEKTRKREKERRGKIALLAPADANIQLLGEWRLHLQCHCFAEIWLPVEALRRSTRIGAKPITESLSSSTRCLSS